MTLSASYPTTLAVFTEKRDHIDVYAADHQNQEEVEIIALQTYIGTNPQGNRPNLTTRLATMMATNGAIAQSSGGFPTGTLYDGQMFYRTDQDVLYVYDGSGWDAQGTSQSNVVFEWKGCVFNSAVTFATTLSLNNPVGFLHFNTGDAYLTCFTTRWMKPAGINTVTIYTLLFDSGSGDAIGFTNIGGVIGSTPGTTTSSPAWASTYSLDVSSLASGTHYEIITMLKNSTGGQRAGMGAILGVAS